MRIARLNVRWMGRQAGSLVYAAEADHALAAGIATEQEAPRRRKIRTGANAAPIEATPPPSSIHETPPEENTSDESAGEPDPDGG